MAIGDVGQLVGGRYRIDRELGCGPGTQTLMVTDLRNGRPCVLRRLSAAASPEARRRFEAQGAILKKIDHPGLPRFVDGFTEGEGDVAERMVVTSYHPGENLKRLIAKGRPLTESQALVLLRRMVPVLAYLHAFEPPLVHRTIGATGIILGPDGRPCLTDLDFAAAEPPAPSREQAPPGPDELALAAPEIYMGGAVPASDIYALGLAVCRGMTERDPAVLLREGARVPLRGALGVSEAFAAVVARMLEPSLERRYPDVRALDADLSRLAGVRGAPAQQPAGRAAEAPRPRRGARPLILAGGALALMALMALVAVTLRQRNQQVPALSLLVAPAPTELVVAPPPQAEAGPVAGSPVDPGSPAQPPTTPGPADGAPATAQVLSAPQAVEPAPVPGPPSVTASQPDSSSPTAVSPSVAIPDVVEGRLFLDGKPFAGTGAPAPRFWLRNDRTKTVEKADVTQNADGFKIRALAPGRYGMSVRIDLNPDNPARFPGDLDAWSEFTIESGRTVSIEVPLRRIIRLLQPVDTNAVIPAWEAPCGSGSVHPGRIVFAWEALPEAANYRARIDRLACGRGYAAVESVFLRTTTDAWVKVDLPSSAEGECYSFSLTASVGKVPVGIMTTHGATGFSWDYRFTVAGGR